MIDIRVVFAAGSSRDGEHKGIAAMTSSLITNGANKQDANTLAIKIEGVGAQLSAGSLRDMAWVDLRSLTMPEVLNVSLGVLADILKKPDFPKSELELIRNQMLIALKNQQQSPGQIAQKLFYKAIYGDHPYGQSPEVEDIQAITRDDVVNFYRQYYVAENAVLSIVGKLQRKQAEALAEELTSNIPRGKKAPELPPVKSLTQAKTIRVDFPSKQSHILIGQLGYKRGDKAQYALYIANHSFGGGGFTSLLMDEIREKRGLAYSVYCYFSPMEERGPFIIGLQTKNEQVDEVISIVMESLNQYTQDGPSGNAFAASIQNITGGSAMKTDTNGKLAQYATLLGFYNLPLDYLAVFNDNIKAESRDSVHKAFRDTIQRKELVTVIVGGE